MVQVAHNLRRPYSMTALDVEWWEPEYLAGMLYYLAWWKGCHSQAPNNNPNIIAYIFNDGLVINVDHSSCKH